MSMLRRTTSSCFAGSQRNVLMNVACSAALTISGMASVSRACDPSGAGRPGRPAAARRRGGGSPHRRRDPARPQSAAMPSLYARLGGSEAVTVAVEQLYERLIADPELAPYFAGQDLDRHARHVRP